MNPDMQKELASLLQLQHELKQHASLQPLISTVKLARCSAQLGAEGGQPGAGSSSKDALDAVSQALKRHALAPQAADCVKKLHGGLNKLGRSIEKSLPHAENVEASVPPLPPASQLHVRRQLLDACALSLATLGHVDAAHQLACSHAAHPTRGAAGGGPGAHSSSGISPSAFDLYRTAASLRRRLQEGDLDAAAEVEQLLRGGGAHLLLLKLHRAVVLQMLLSGSCSEAGGTGLMQVSPNCIAFSLRRTFCRRCCTRATVCRPSSNTPNQPPPSCPKLWDCLPLPAS